MADLEKIRRIQAEIKDLDLDFMRGLISPNEYNEKAKTLIIQFVEAGGMITGFVGDLSSTPPAGSKKLLDAASKATGGLVRRLWSKVRREQEKTRQYKEEIQRLEEEIRQLELDYVQGLVPVGTFVPKMVTLKSKHTNQAHRSAQYS